MSISLHNNGLYMYTTVYATFMCNLLHTISTAHYFNVVKLCIFSANSFLYIQFNSIKEGWFSFN